MVKQNRKYDRMSCSLMVKFPSGDKRKKNIVNMRAFILIFVRITQGAGNLRRVDNPRTWQPTKRIERTLL